MPACGGVCLCGEALHQSLCALPCRTFRRKYRWAAGQWRDSPTVRLGQAPGAPNQPKGRRIALVQLLADQLLHAPGGAGRPQLPHTGRMPASHMRHRHRQQCVLLGKCRFGCLGPSVALAHSTLAPAALPLPGHSCCLPGVLSSGQAAPAWSCCLAWLPPKSHLTWCHRTSPEQGYSQKADMYKPYAIFPHDTPQRIGATTLPAGLVPPIAAGICDCVLSPNRSTYCWGYREWRDRAHNNVFCQLYCLPTSRIMCHKPLTLAACRICRSGARLLRRRPQYWR